MDKPKFLTLLQALCATKRVEATAALQLGYWIGCNDLTDEQFRQAATRAVRECEFMPSPNELRRLAGEDQVEAMATHAWTQVLKAISAVGSYQSVDFGPLVNAVVRSMGGWVELCGTDGDELRKWGRKDFEATYNRFAGSRFLGEMGEHLAGISERSNKALGVDAKVVKLLDAVVTSRPEITGGKAAPRLGAVRSKEEPA